MRFVLASSSPRRRELLESLGLEFETMKPDIDETQREDESPLDYVRRLSAEKAGAVTARLAAELREQDALVIAADTIVLAADTMGVGGEPEHEVLLGKPETAQQAREMLRLLREYPHTVYTAFRVVKLSPQPDNEYSMEYIDELVATRVTMRDYTDDEIEAYIDSGDPFDKAGSYAIQNEAFHPVAAIDGCYTNVVGLPLCAVKRVLATFNVYGLGVTDGCDCPLYIGDNP
jgi:septum formation protein